jgi:hypothetical protein
LDRVQDDIANYGGNGRGKMDKQKGQEDEMFDVYIRRVEDQEIKGILLKLKNEIRRSNAPWESVKAVLSSLWNKKKGVLIEVLPLILK